MLGIRLFFINGILLTAAINIKALESEDTVNSVKSILERDQGFNNTDNADNIHFLDKVQRVISKMKKVFLKNNNARRSMNENIKLEQFTDFIQDVLKILKKYDDIDLENFFAVFSKEVRNYHYRGCKFYELTENFAFRLFLSGLLNDIKIQPGDIIKTKLEALANKMKKKQYDGNEKELIDVINSMYRQDSINTFHNVLMNLDAYRLKSRKNLDLGKIVKDGLRSVIFDHYTKLHHNARRALKLQVNEYWNKLSQQPISQVKDTVKRFKAKKNEIITTSTDSGMNKRIIFKEKDRYIEQDIKYNQLRNDEKKITLKSLYLPNTVGTTRSTTYKLNKADIIHFKKDVNTGDIVKNTEKVIHKINRKLNNVERRSHIPSRTTRQSRTARFFYKEDNMNLKYETDAYEYLTTQVRKNKLTLMTLYPEYVSAWTSSKRLDGRRKLSHRKSVDNIKYMWKKDDISDVTSKSKIPKAIRLVKKLRATFEVGKANSPTLRAIKFKKIKRGAASKKFKQLNNKIRFSAAKETSSEKLMRLKKKFSLSKSTKTLIRRRFFSADNSYNNQQSFLRDPIVSLESSSDDSPKVEKKDSYITNVMTNTNVTNSAFTVWNDSFQVQHPKVITKQIGSHIMIDKLTLNNETEVKGDKVQINREKPKVDGNTTNIKFDGKRNSTAVDSMKEIPQKVRVSEITVKNSSNDFNGNKSMSEINNQTIHSSDSDELHSNNEYWRDSNTNIDTNGLKSKEYLENNQMYNESDSSYNDTDSNQVKNEQTMESNEELEAWEPKAKPKARKSFVDYENYYTVHNHNSRKWNKNEISDVKNENMKNIGNIATTLTTEPPKNTATINSIHTVAIVKSKPSPKVDPAFYFADVIENIDNIKKEETTVSNFNLITKDTTNIIENGEIKDISEEKLKNEVPKSGEIHFGRDKYKDTNVRIKDINENDLVDEEFPEFVQVLGKISDRV